MSKVTLDPSDELEAVLIDMVQVARAKRADYAAGGDPWQNFYDSGNQLDLTPGHSVELLIGTKQARLRNLLPKFWSLAKNAEPKNEPIVDTLLDRAVYSVIAVALWRRGAYEREA